MMYKSQIGQDKELDEKIFKFKENGVFVEVGALDGVHSSNTYFFEKERGWTGLLIEPNPTEFEKMLESDRTSHKENCAISNEEGEVNFMAITGPCNVLSGIVEFYNDAHAQRIENELAEWLKCPKGHEHYSTREIIKMPCLKLQTLLDKHNINNIDLLSLDVEGAELQVLESIDYDKTNIECFLIENNYGLDKEMAFLNSKGYGHVGNIQWDAVFIKKGSKYLK